ncbi:hypothetical protein [Sediminispirochaeta smaragdinae]|jgi:ribosome-binding protein aMBF1 (putative translation factor)|uniref:50S ribosomal protein L24 n=1 Tax=Sediminispirochaeta smaragdinae (strain DSM 11293 / JCM 15392 / SEBR 4228) TaxID=573413 RepID=E1R773_SEDSS|nr:hypothetical protein [Sediminispirochaeta smaragdinae]ADK81400.1 conserved hypothetical protein [Sediminispirochaeta smaragdinae DSM 11293]
MSKAHRGSGIRELIKSGRGTCPLCNRTGIKLLYEVEKEGKKIKICKECNKAVAHGKVSLSA